MKKFWVQYWVTILVLMAVATFLCISVSDNAKERSTETVTAWFLDSYKEGGKRYIVVQRLGSDGHEPWIISGDDFTRLTDNKRYEFVITGFPGGIVVIDVKPETVDN